MIVKNQGKRDTSNLYTFSTVELFHNYRELCFDLAISKRIKYLRPVLITTLVVAVLGFITGIPSLLSMTSLGILISLLMITFYFIPNMSPMPTEKSESGVSLDLAPYPITEDNYEKASEKIEKIYGTDQYITGSLSFQEKPLSDPVTINDQKIVGIYAAVELSLADQPSEYYIMLETGQSVAIDYHTFLELSHTMHKNSTGLVSIPVLTGQDESIVWGLYGDMQAAITAAKREKKAAHRVLAYRDAINKTEELLDYLALQRMATSW